MIFFESDHSRSAGELYYSHYFTNLKSPLHLHNSFELVCVSEGDLTLILDGNCFSVRAGQGALIFPNQTHGYQSPAATKGYVCVFSATLIGEFARKTQKTQPVSPLFDLRDPSLGSNVSAAATRRYLLKSILYDTLYLFEQTAVYQPRRTHGTELLGGILSLISHHYKEPLTMQTIARELGYDHRYLTNLLQKGLHTTFRKLLNEYRIANAKELLTETDLSVERIAGECGYESLCSFNRNFKQLTTATPSAYRKSRK